MLRGSPWIALDKPPNPHRGSARSCCLQPLLRAILLRGTARVRAAQGCWRGDVGAVSAPGRRGPGV